MKLETILLQLLVVATAGSPISLPETNLANSQISQLQTEKRSPADAKMNADEAILQSRGMDGGDLWQRSAADAEMDADEAVVYPDGRDPTRAWAAPPTRKPRST